MSSELHRATFGGPNETFGGGKFASVEEFKEDVGPSNLYARTKLAVTLFNKVSVRFEAPPLPSTRFRCVPDSRFGSAPAQLCSAFRIRSFARR